MQNFGLEVSIFLFWLQTLIAHDFPHLWHDWSYCTSSKSSDLYLIKTEAQGHSTTFKSHVLELNYPQIPPYNTNPLEITNFPHIRSGQSTPLLLCRQMNVSIHLCLYLNQNDQMSKSKLNSIQTCAWFLYWLSKT